MAVDRVAAYLKHDSTSSSAYDLLRQIDTQVKAHLRWYERRVSR
jgi:hypothetical protein